MDKEDQIKRLKNAFSTILRIVDPDYKPNKGKKREEAPVVVVVEEKKKKKRAKKERDGPFACPGRLWEGKPCETPECTEIKGIKFENHRTEVCKT